MRYFSKFVFKQKVLLSDGSSFDGFERVGQDDGAMATNDGQIIREMEINIRAKRGGVVEITGEQYLELQSKKKEDLNPQWREEWKPRSNALESALQARSLKSHVEPAEVSNAAQRPAGTTPPVGGETSFRPVTSIKVPK